MLFVWSWQGVYSKTCEGWEIKVSLVCASNSQLDGVV